MIAPAFKTSLSLNYSEVSETQVLESREGVDTNSIVLRLRQQKHVSWETAVVRRRVLFEWACRVLNRQGCRHLLLLRLVGRGWPISRLELKGRKPYTLLYAMMLAARGF